MVWKKIENITRLKLTQYGSHPKRKLIFQPSVFRCELLVSEKVSRFYINTDFISEKSHEFHQASSNISRRKDQTKSPPPKKKHIQDRTGALGVQNLELKF